MLRNNFWHKYYEIKGREIIKDSEISESSIVTDDNETLEALKKKSHKRGQLFYCFMRSFRNTPRGFGRGLSSQLSRLLLRHFPVCFSVK
jgi:hypothetical protein